MESSEFQEHINKETSLGKSSLDIFSLFYQLERKKTEKNHKTNDRRNELRKENDKKIRRGSKGRRHDYTYNNVYLDNLFELKGRINDKLEILKQNGNIIGLFKLYGVELKETYNNYLGLCPFHKEKTPSFSVSKGNHVAKCYGCGKGYQLITMLFVLKFGDGSVRKGWRFAELEKDIDKFIGLSPIVKTKPKDENKESNNRKTLEEDIDVDVDGLPF